MTISLLLVSTIAVASGPHATRDGAASEGDAASIAIQTDSPPDEAEVGPNRRLRRSDWVYPGPLRTRPRRGRVAAGDVVVVMEEVEGPGCRGPWGRVLGDGFICLDHAEPTTESPDPMPRLIAFDPPTPVEFWSYVEDGEWEMDAPGDAELLLPWIYGKRWRKWQGVFYESIRDYERYREPAEDQLEGNRKYHFAALVPTRRGTVLQRPDGDVVPMDGIHVYPVTRFAGYNLEVSPLPPGTIAAWVHGYAGAEMFPTPGPDAVAVLSLPYHMPLVVDAVPADDTGHWWRVIDGLGSGVDGFVNDLAGVRRWSFAPPPTDVVEGQVWLDVDVEQQMLTLYEGWRAIYVTMVSTGKVGHSTPLGTFRIFDKMATVDMINREDAPEDDRYHVEAVPWSMHFYPRYALHGAYWHWGFGNRASHGCVNLAPLDAHWLFDRLDPVLPDGWHSVYEDAEHLGSLLRIRYGGDVGRERRLAAGAVWKK